MPQLSIILPTFNGARFLRPQINSILAQSAPDFELLLIDDGSRDDTVTILDDFARRDSRVRRLPSTGNRGQNRRLVELLGHATGEFVAVADQDDVWDRDRNARLLAAIGDRALAFGRSQLMDADGRDMGRSILEVLGVDATRAGPLQSLYRPLVSAHAAIVRRDWLDPAAFYGPTPFDWLLGVEAHLSAGLVYVDDAIVRHRVHDGNQNNGGVLDGRRLLSLYRLRESTSLVRKERLYFFLVLDQVSRSLAVPPPIRRAFQTVAHACRYAWFHPLNFKPGKGVRLERELIDLLSGFSPSPEDRVAFAGRVRSLTRPQIAPTNIRRSVSHYLGHA